MIPTATALPWVVTWTRVCLLCWEADDLLHRPPPFQLGHFVEPYLTSHTLEGTDVVCMY